MIGSLTSNTEGKRLALADVLFKVAAGIVFMLMMNQIIGMVDMIASVIGLAEDDYTLKLAVFHTIFNVAGVIIMVPFVNQLVQLVTNVMPERKIPLAEPKYLNESALELPDTAIEAVRKEASIFMRTLLRLLPMVLVCIVTTYSPTRIWKRL